MSCNVLNAWYAPHSLCLGFTACCGFPCTHLVLQLYLVKLGLPCISRKQIFCAHLIKRQFSFRTNLAHQSFLCVFPMPSACIFEWHQQTQEIFPVLHMLKFLCLPYLTSTYCNSHNCVTISICICFCICGICHMTAAAWCCPIGGFRAAICG